MKKPLEFAFSILFITFCTICFTNMKMLNYQEAKLSDYHYAMVNEIESSDFSPTVIQRYMNEGKYDVSIQNKGVKGDLKIYQVTTKKSIGMPIFGFNQTYVKESVAR